MISFTPYMDQLLLAGLAILSAGFMLHAVCTVINRVRLRSVRMSWGNGRLAGQSGSFWIYVALIGMGAGMFLIPEEPDSRLVSVATIWIGMHGALASSLTGRVFVTDNGLVRSLNHPSGMIAWYQVTDYVVRDKRGKKEYLVIYQKYDGGSRFGEVQPCSRFAITVPERKERTFKKIVSCKLGKSIDKTVLPTGDLRTVT